MDEELLQEEENEQQEEDSLSLSNLEDTLEEISLKIDEITKIEQDKILLEEEKVIQDGLLKEEENDIIIQGNNELLEQLEILNETISNEIENENKNVIADEIQDYSEILVSIDDRLLENNSYLYTLNIHFAGFFIIVLGLILTKALIGFMKIFI